MKSMVFFIVPFCVFLLILSTGCDAAWETRRAKPSQTCQKVDAAHLHLTLEGIWYEVKRSGSIEFDVVPLRCPVMSIGFWKYGYGWHLQLNKTAFTTLRYPKTTNHFAHQPFSLQSTSEGAFVYSEDKLQPHKKEPDFFIVHFGDQFLLTYSCIEKARGVFEESASIYSRDPHPKKRELKEAEKVFQEKGIEVKLEDVDQHRCPEFGLDSVGELSRSMRTLKVFNERSQNLDWEYLAYKLCFLRAESLEARASCWLNYTSNKRDHQRLLKLDPF